MLTILWPIYLITTMIYVMPSGLPQPSALFLGAAFILIFLAPFARVGKQVDTSLALLFSFVSWCILVSVAWFVWTSELIYVKAPLYYLYNSIAFITVVQLACRDPAQFTKLTRNALLLMLLSQVVFIAVLPNRVNDVLEREIGTFNAPNQLAYWAILSISTYMLMPGRRLPADLVVMAAGTWVVIASTSKAGLLALAIATVLWVVLDSRRQGRALALAAFGVPALLVIAAALQHGVALPDSERIDLLRLRVERDVPEPDDTLMGRGYTTILEHPNLLPFGAAEGNFGALTRGENGVFQPGELHSTFGAILMGYGIVGLTLFLGFLLAVARSGGLAASLWMMPGLIYGIAHQGLRFSPFWIMLACVASARRMMARSPGVAAAKSWVRPVPPYT